MSTAYREEAVIKLANIGKSYYIGKQEVPVLSNITMTINKGEFVSVMGPSGAGKSTLMNILGCLDRPSFGSYQLDGKEVANPSDSELAYTRNKKIGFVFQNFNLLPRISAIKNIALPLVYAGTNDAERMQQALVMLEKVGIAERKDHRPNELSGGQRQRVAIARALAMSPKVLLCDEITSALDPELVNEVLSVVRQLAREGMTLIMVTHEMRFAREVGDKLVFMHQGKVHEVGDPKVLFANPQTPELANFIGTL